MKSHFVFLAIFLCFCSALSGQSPLTQSTPLSDSVMLANLVSMANWTTDTVPTRFTTHMETRGPAIVKTCRIVDAPATAVEANQLKKPVLFAKLSDGQIVQYDYASYEEGAYEKRFPELAKGLEYIGEGQVWSYNGVLQSDTILRPTTFFWHFRQIERGVPIKGLLRDGSQETVPRTTAAHVSEIVVAQNTPTIQDVRDMIAFPKESGIYKSLVGLVDCWYHKAKQEGCTEDEAVEAAAEKLFDQMLKLGQSEK